MITFYCMVHKKEKGPYHRIEKLMKEMPEFLSPGKGMHLLWQIQNSTQEASC